MKIAVCISGQPRSYTKGYEYLKKNVLDQYDTDIFIHTWKNKVYGIKDVIDLYKPVDYIIDELSIFDKDALNSKYTNTPDPEKFPPSNMVYAYYSLFQSCLLKIRNEIVSRTKIQPSTFYAWTRRKMIPKLPLSIIMEIMKNFKKEHEISVQ